LEQKKKQNDRQNQDGRQAGIFQSSVNIYDKSIETWDLGRKKYCRSNFFSKLQKGGLNQDGVSNHYVFLLALTHNFSCNKHYGTSVGPKYRFTF
jgi:hypothetical protein